MGPCELSLILLVQFDFLKIVLNNRLLNYNKLLYIKTADFKRICYIDKSIKGKTFPSNITFKNTTIINFIVSMRKYITRNIV